MWATPTRCRPSLSMPNSGRGGASVVSATSTTDPITKEVTWTGASTFTTEFGTSGVDRATGIAVENG